MTDETKKSFIQMLEKSSRPIVIAGSGSWYSGASASLKEFVGIFVTMLKNINIKESKLFFIKDKNKRHNIFGLWSVSLIEKLEADIIKGERKVERHGRQNRVLRWREQASTALGATRRR